ncbi:MAG: DUF3426 domain-containing protein [Burkholderiaceae bacterium]|jgi:Protein of unknown function (DUF3426).|nr:DUF3426 domain-containing protein [Burkholderiaceae bacterium]
MSQITRCPFCGTRFRVVTDQLRISAGWVRCGQCHEIFDASAQLVPASAQTLWPDAVPAADSQQPPAGAGLLDSASPAATIAAAQRSSSDDASSLQAGASILPAFLAHAYAPPAALLDRGPPEGASPAAPPPEQELEGYELPFAELRDSGWPQEDEEAQTGDAAVDEHGTPPVPAHGQEQHEGASAMGYMADAQTAHEPAALAPPEDAGFTTDASASEMLMQANEVPTGYAWDDEAPLEDAEPDVQEPGFVRAARRRAFWRRPWVRAGLAALSVLLLAALALQVAVQERDAIAAAAPATRPWLQQVCAPLGCSVAPLRRIADVVIDSSSFQKGRGDSYHLTFSLQNRAAHALAMPALELTLTDAQDQPTVRRVLLPKDIGAPAELPPRGGWGAALTVVVTTGGARVAGYRLLAFYP